MLRNNNVQSIYNVLMKCKMFNDIQYITRVNLMNIVIKTNLYETLVMLNLLNIASIMANNNNNNNNN